ncbi:putative glycosyltransferase EpsJ [compost metagenome]
MEDFPLVSVIIPCYNHEQYVEECILSVVNQTYRNVQLIVIDDGSKDKSVEVIEKLQAKYQFIFEAQNNIGLSSTLNKAITKYCTGKYISIVASDDFWHPDKIKYQVEHYEQHDQLGLVYCDVNIVNANSEVIDSFSLGAKTEQCTTEDIIRGISVIPALTVMVKKSIYDDIGLFDVETLVEDWDMWIRISLKYNIGFVDKKLAYYRTHDTNISSRVKLMMQHKNRIFEKLKVINLPLYNKTKQFMQLHMIHSLINSDPVEAAKYIKITPQNLMKKQYRKIIFKYLLTGKAN